MTLENPLVSIIVCTYNSSKYIIETLESARIQTYQKIELIISDDCSSDDTLELCRKWIDENDSRFVRVKLMTVEKNTGVAANGNRSLYTAKGEWVKYLPGDDMLLPDCIESNIRYIQQSDEDISFLFTRFKFLVGDRFVDNHIRINYYINNEKEFEKNAKGQFLSLIKEVFVCPPTMFVKKKAMIEIKCFDEEFYETDDYPLFLRATEYGFKFYLNPEETIIYRFHEKSLSEKHYQKWVNIDEKIINKYFPIKYRFAYPFHYLDHTLNVWIKKRVIEKKPTYGKLIKLINPLALYRSTVRKIS